MDHVSCTNLDNITEGSVTAPSNIPEDAPQTREKKGRSLGSDFHEEGGEAEEEEGEAMGDERENHARNHNCHYNSLPVTNGGVFVIVAGTVDLSFLEILIVGSPTTKRDL
ncbi:Uncharacterized protein Rs2_04980 [Raphanus sativus]|nr:Uncharacterized protein Rs2_04980 [Raphanus sativus]